MKITFRLGWLKSGRIDKKSFKHAAAYELFNDYLSRISKFSQAEASSLQNLSNKPSTKVWICDRGIGSKLVSSEQLAMQLEHLQSSGVRHLEIMIGGPDGFSRDFMRDAAPDFIWSFGPTTLPHELASIVAAEQIYRAYAILRNLPYHSGH
jgi:23S rRNA (pseudouridine1915-N3)-methyltransferase